MALEVSSGILTWETLGILWRDPIGSRGIFMGQGLVCFVVVVWGFFCCVLFCLILFLFFHAQTLRLTAIRTGKQ